jgi:hypothetical protein
VSETKEPKTDETVRVVKIAAEHLRSDTWIAYRLDTSDWIDQIRYFLENDGNVRLSIQVEDMQRTAFENLPEYKA